MTRRSLLKTTAVPAFAQAVLNNPVVEENKKPGDGSWQLKYYRRDRANGSGLRSPEIEGYASDTSVYPAESIDLMVSADPARKFTIDTSTAPAITQARERAICCELVRWMPFRRKSR